MNEEQRNAELMLLEIVKKVPNDVSAFILEGYIQEYGPLSDEIGGKIQQILMKKSS